MMRLVAITAALLLTICSSSSLAYLKLGAVVNGHIVDATWHQQPIGYYITNREGGGVTANDLAGAVQRATATWSAVESANVQFSFQGMTTAPAEGTDGRNVIGFIDRPDLDRVIGATSFMVDAVTGSIYEADIFFNSRFVFSVAPEGQPGRVDLGIGGPARARPPARAQAFRAWRDRKHWQRQPPRHCSGAVMFQSR